MKPGAPCGGQRARAVECTSPDEDRGRGGSHVQYKELGDPPGGVGDGLRHIWKPSKARAL